MSETELTPIPETLARLEALQTAAQEFAAREDKLNREHQARVHAAQQQCDTAQATANDRLGDQVDAVRDDYEARRANTAQFFARRKRRINTAHANVRRKLMDGITETEGREKFAVQKGTLDAERERVNNLAQAEAKGAEYQQQLANLRGAFSELETSARKAFGSYALLRGVLSAEPTGAEPDLSADENALFERLQKLHEATAADLQSFRGNLFCRLMPGWLMGVVALLVVGLGVLAGLVKLGKVDASVAQFYRQYYCCWFIYAGVGWQLIRQASVAGGQKKLAAKIAAALALAKRYDASCFEKANLRLESDKAQVQAHYEHTLNRLNERWKSAAKGGIQGRASQPLEIDARVQRIYQTCEQWQVRLLKQMEQDEREAVELLQASKQTLDNHQKQEFTTRMTALEVTFKQQWQTLVSEWTRLVAPLADQLRREQQTAGKLFPAWQEPAWANWQPPAVFGQCVQFGQLEVKLAQLAGKLPKDARLAIPGGPDFSVPLTLHFPARGSLLFETPKDGGDEAIRAINNLIFRILAIAPPGKVSFTIIDPVGLGQNFAALMHLADYEEGSLNSRIWTQAGQIEERLAELSEHMEKVIQMYLRNDYATITEYNAQAGKLAEKYHFLVVASFPANFSDNATRRLRNIAASGARCGVFTLIHWDQRLATNQDFVADELRANSVNLTRTDKGFEFAGWRRPGTRLVLDAPPTPETATPFLHQVGRSSRNSTRVEVPFEQIAPRPEEIWTGNTAEEIRVPIGRSGATKMQYMELGKATRQHALIAGKTGSGKSTLFHVIITNLALYCAPDQVEFYLVDFKKGVEFKCYGTRKLPHAKVVAIESDREFGLSVLQRVDEELRRRGDLFRQAGAQDVAGYRRSTGKPMPRALLMIDEFQEFFTEEDRISQGAAVLLDRIVRQGRAFGVHVILGSQTLGGAYTLARATIGQMVVRVALQCNEADAYLIMDQDNPAPRLLSRPGEGIYNDSAGQIEGNAPFQVVWLGEDVRDAYLADVRQRAEATGQVLAEPFVFEGNAPADVRDNLLLRARLLPEAGKPPVPARLWLGAPNAIKGPTEALFPRQSGANLLMVGQADERTGALFGLSLIALAAQFAKSGAQFYLLDSTPPGFPQREFLEGIAAGLPQTVTTLKEASLEEQMARLGEQLKQRSDGQADAPEIFVFIHGLQHFKKLRAEDDFSFSGSSSEASPAATFLSLINEGPARGIHIIAACDTYNNVGRFLGRKTLAEFELRVLFQMSATDSASLIDSPDASTLGLHRALFHHDREGYNETFRPYARPADDWVRATLAQLQANIA